jgi:hypothetical protein
MLALDGAGHDLVVSRLHAVELEFAREVEELSAFHHSHRSSGFGLQRLGALLDHADGGLHHDRSAETSGHHRPNGPAAPVMAGGLHRRRCIPRDLSMRGAVSG